MKTDNTNIVRNENENKKGNESGIEKPSGNKKLRVLLSGFKPFNGEKINPSWEAVRKLEDTKNMELFRIQLPVSYQRAWPALQAETERLHPDVVICVGQAGGRGQITPEKCAINWMEASIPDEDGVFADGRKIDPDLPDGLFSTLPVHEMARAIRLSGAPGAVSFTAGTYVCNTLMFSVLAYLHENPSLKNVRAGFIHVPYLTGQVVGKSGNLPSLELSRISSALQAALDALAASVAQNGEDEVKKADEDVREGFVC